jgi:hypothetical protein
MTGAEMCEHGDFRAACLECLGQPRPPVAKSAPKPKRPTFAPKSAEDPIRELRGDKDVSVPVPELEPTLGRCTDWLLAYGYPHDLRKHGWVYLRVANRLAARVKVRRMAWREVRSWRSAPAAGTDHNPGPGMVFEVDPDTWEEVDIPLGELADRQRQGYRYLITSGDGLDVRHLTVGDRVPEGDET